MDLNNRNQQIENLKYHQAVACIDAIISGYMDSHFGIKELSKEDIKTFTASPKNNTQTQDSNEKEIIDNIEKNILAIYNHMDYIPDIDTRNPNSDPNVLKSIKEILLTISNSNNSELTGRLESGLELAKNPENLFIPVTAALIAAGLLIVISTSTNIKIAKKPESGWDFSFELIKEPNKDLNIINTILSYFTNTTTGK